MDPWERESTAFKLTSELKVFTCCLMMPVYILMLLVLLYCIFR